MKKVLVTFGCSWMHGTAASYESGMTLEDYNILRNNRETIERCSFRGLLAKKYGFENINFGMPGSSNSRQFLLLKKFFNSNQYKDLVKENAEIVVLHGITSTARAYFYDNKFKEAQNIVFNNVNPEIVINAVKNYVSNYYDHEHEVQLLTEEIQFINQFYKGNGIKNLWFDTFNTHRYNFELDNFLGHADCETRDLLSQMALQTGIEDMDKKYHTSTWKIDTNRVEFLVNSGHLNPFSQHPTKLGHQLIADIISKEFENIRQHHE